MILYIILATILFILALTNLSKEYRTNIGITCTANASIFLFLIITIVLGGIRWETGTDWAPYYHYFDSFETWKEYNNGRFEISYVLLNFIVKQFANSYSIFLVLLSFLYIFISFNVIKGIALYPLISYYLFFCTNIGGIFPVRQHLAVAVGLTSIFFIQRRNKLLFILTVLLASSFHISMLIWFIAYPFYHYKNQKIHIIISLFVIAILTGIFGRNVILFIIEKTGIQAVSSSGTISRIIKYFTGKNKRDSYDLLMLFGVMTKRLYIIPLILVFYQRLIKTNSYVAGLINLYLFGNIIYMLFAFNENFVLLTRMASPFLFMEIFILPPIIKIFRNEYEKCFILFALFALGLMKLWFALNAHPGAFIPYRSVFDIL